MALGSNEIPKAVCWVMIVMLHTDTHDKILYTYKYTNTQIYMNSHVTRYYIRKLGSLSLRLSLLYVADDGYDVFLWDHPTMEELLLFYKKK